jgi:hypothetical protein
MPDGAGERSGLGRSEDYREPKADDGRGLGNLSEFRSSSTRFSVLNELCGGHPEVFENSLFGIAVNFCLI